MNRVCRHCETRVVSASRGLCRTCSDTPGVRDLYPLPPDRLKYAQRGVGGGHRRRAPLPAEPTAHRPGTPEKEAVLTGRAERGEQLHHPHDARADP